MISIYSRTSVPGCGLHSAAGTIVPAATPYYADSRSPPSITTAVFFRATSPFASGAWEDAGMPRCLAVQIGLLFFGSLLFKVVFAPRRDWLQQLANSRSEKLPKDKNRIKTKRERGRGKERKPNYKDLSERRPTFVPTSRDRLCWHDLNRDQTQNRLHLWPHRIDTTSS